MSLKKLNSKIDNVNLKLNLGKRSKNIFKNFSLNIIYKIIGVFLSFLTLPLLIDYLSVEKYGIWVTLVTILSWTSLFDIGIGNGLRNKLTICLSKNEITKGREYITTAYVSLSIIIIVITTIGIYIIPFIKWNKVFNTNALTQQQFIALTIVVFVLYMINFILSLCNSLYYSIQKAAMTGRTAVINNILVLISIIIIRRFQGSNLVLMATIYTLSGTISYIIITVLFFRERPELLPKLKYFNRNNIKYILNDGIKFFVIQIACIIIFTTDNMIITQVLGPQAVTSYNITQKLFGIIGMTYTLMLTPLWSAYTEAYSQLDYLWIKKVINKLNYSMIAVIAGVIIVSLLSNTIIDLWIRKSIYPSKLLILLMGIYTIISTWNNIYAYFLNGIGALKVSLWLAIIGSIVNIPLSIYFAENLGLGTSGVILGTIFSLLPSSFIQPIQSYVILNRLERSNKVKKNIYNME
ncbi:oligosaccharide flippase family protein [Clostridium estertheticum]|uniref:lipopolysaccharide biosynthesis protein n=1 Tax=Clostridium estertheticum TaxID=238834 RepID=UPI001C0B2E9E|nr:oligosaccharide flippase family protein [Clostridium estertheticum]MBU3200976.1 oligosaccharide flippase family protein [Clostridium estertheticum]WAG63398.1 oligosaccharide flippase family protein [Clostridium estertheticum]